ncbi:MAG TPA: pyridoxamine 5'-phosphate oxidase family protein [candidate division Zixibacteria bacterium]|nr:pyridoxamine 5'-phosphate oxidase family protein [candidate division Zixibacteria bacterium]
MKQLPEKFIKWAYHQRAEVVRSQLADEEISRDSFFIAFTRHTPAIITNGSAGLNGSIKGIGFLPKKEFLGGILKKYKTHIQSPPDETYSRRGLQLLNDLVWAEGRDEIIDFTVMGTLELALDHTWRNLQENDRATLLFYQPPMISYEVRCRAEIHIGDEIHEFINAQHDVYHGSNIDKWDKRPAYLFRLEEIFDNSVGKNAFGKQIFP